ncbi:hypothetical protein HYPSUDRAFT_41052 [Hypholoma sublateritium FD-334 SS-4]|uniref:DUF300-domain-containing protein n=1 Tax=Hypholoma sublateritium (strain FD-334 SS-4) TaxID=945553 RepID=A0A0D2P151_HYPSF|nr:hypothetical protein HYPSUDRAFT_41052 [Hypholoma sublateritium FD-334 SS-4]
MPCPTSVNQISIDQSQFWDSDGIHWSTHRIGWAIAGGCAAITTVISAISILQHCRNFTVPAQQRQILRILYMPPVYAIISFCSYRFYRDYVYYSFIEVAYEAVTLSAFLLLIVEYVADTASGHSTANALERKDKMPLPFPFGCWRYRPTKAYFMYTVKWSVLQYIIIRPAASIAGIICEKLDILCDSDGYSWKYASVYLAVIDFISISIALYGLLIFYGLMRTELEGRRPLAKFLSIKLIVMFTFYQSFVIGVLNVKIIKATDYWTVVNIKDGLNALLICIEMVFFSALMWWAYPAREYSRKPGQSATADFAREIWSSLRFFAGSTRPAHGYAMKVPTDLTHSTSGVSSHSLPLSQRAQYALEPAPGSTHDEAIMMRPYPFAQA